MGRVFTAEQIANGAVPAAGAHTLAAEFIVENLFGPPGEPPRVPGLISGMPYGTVMLGNEGPRSDLDYLVNYSIRDSHTALLGIATVTAEASRLFRVPISAKPMFEGSMQNPLKHNLDFDFAHHLRAARTRGRQEWIRGEPIPDDLTTQQFPYSVGEYALYYCSYKLRDLAQYSASIPSWFFFGHDLGMSEEKNMEFRTRGFQIALELPDAICRKVYPAIPRRVLWRKRQYHHELDKQIVFDRVTEWLQDKRWLFADGKFMAREMRYLRALNEEYSALLSQTLAGGVSLGAYNKWITEQYKGIYERAHLITTCWVRALEQCLDNNQLAEKARIGGSRTIDGIYRLFRESLQMDDDEDLQP